MVAFPKRFSPFLQENCTVTPGALKDVFVMTLAGGDKRLHATEEGKKIESTVM